MLGRMTVKRGLKRGVGWAAACSVPFLRRPTEPRVCILMYHRVADIDFVDPNLDAWSISPRAFGRQIAALSEFAEFVRLSDVPHRLLGSQVPERPLVCVTFDDGFENFGTHALPVLIRHSVPATLFVVTSCIGSPAPMPFDRWGQKYSRLASPETWRAMTWENLEDAARTGLVSVGSHSDRHLNGSECAPEELAAEAGRSRAVLRERLRGGTSDCYAYPYGSTRLGQLTDQYVAAVREAGYKIAVSTDLGMADHKSDVLRLPRVEAHGLDSGAVIRAKARGALAPLALTDRLRTSNRGPG